jgi:hypothetical protein
MIFICSTAFCSNYSLTANLAEITIISLVIKEPSRRYSSFLPGKITAKACLLVG